jgi:RNA polymerase sigma-70 factor (ECF subfamily)
LEPHGFDGNVMSRDNEAWLNDLRDGAPKQHEALSDLREALIRGLRRALSAWPAADDAFVEDAVQDSLIRVLERLGQFEGRSRFITWATSIGIRVAMGELRRRRWKDVSLDELVSDASFTPENARQPGPGPEEQWEQGALLEKMHAVIKSELTEKQRRALIAELRGMPQDEIARQLGSNRNAVYKLTHDARKRLKQGLERAGYEAADVRAAFGT